MYYTILDIRLLQGRLSWFQTSHKTKIIPSISPDKDMFADLDRVSMLQEHFVLQHLPVDLVVDLAMEK